MKTLYQMHRKRLLIGMCSWNNAQLLKICINSILPNIDLSIDGIAVVLNESDLESINFLHDLKIPFISIPENRGVLAIDYLIPFIQNSEYFLNSNDDMVFSKGFAEDLIQIIENHYPCSASCSLVENFGSNNGCVYVDTSLENIYEEETLNKFLNFSKLGKYKRDYHIISYNHPICVKSSDFLEIGGYSGDWDMDFASGYARDDMFAYNLLSIHNGNFKFIASKNSWVFHASSASMKRLPNEIRFQHNQDTFIQKTGNSINALRNFIGIFSPIN
jgi:GT2 family glycosyltransferase